MGRWLPICLFLMACPLDPLTVVATAPNSESAAGNLPLAPLGSQVVVPFRSLDSDVLQAYFNGKPATIVGRSPDRLILQVPSDVVTDQGKAVLDLYQDGQKVLEQSFGVVPGISAQTPLGGFFSPYGLTAGSVSTATPAPTSAAASTSTASPSPIASVSSSPSPSATAQPTPTPTPAPTPTATASPSSLPSAAPTPVPAGQAEVNAHVDF